MLGGDNVKSARRMAAAVADPRAAHFHDPRPQHRAGHAFAHSLLPDPPGPAWDVYLFFDKGAVWDDAPPKPREWWHQLSGAADRAPDRFAPGQIKERLHDTMHTLTGLPCAATQ